MGVRMRDLAVVGYAEGFTLWLFKARDLPLSNVLEPGFFLDAGDLMAPEDMVLVTGRRGALLGVLSDLNGPLKLNKVT